jgi:PAS domain S-box-containing protein
MNLVSLVTFLSAVIYIFLAIYGLRMKPRTRLISIFVVLCICCALWAFCIAFMFPAENWASAWLWFRMSAPGWCLGPAILLHFGLILTEDKESPRSNGIQFLMYIPALVFTVIAMSKGLTATTLTYKSFGWSPLNDGQSPGYWAFTLYYIICIISSIILVWRWGTRATLAREKQQARIVVVCTIIGTILAFLNESLLPVLGYGDLPKIPVVLWLIWAFGLWFVITKYGFMIVTPVVATREIIRSIDDLMIMFDVKGKIIEINSPVNNLLLYRDEELLRSPVDKITVNSRGISEIMERLKTEQVDSMQQELDFKTRDSLAIPVELSVSAIRDEFGDVICFVLVARDLRPTLALQNEIAERIRAEAELKKAYAETERAQKELAESEKMAALGQLIAGIAHEINTPIGAINSSVGSIAEAVPVALEQIPEVFLQLDYAGKEEFMNMLDTALKAEMVFSMREKRTLRKSLTARLEEAEIPDATYFADSLVNLGINDLSDSMRILLLHPQNKLIFEALNNISGLIRGVKNIQTATMKVRKIAFALKNFARFDNSGERITFDIREGLETVLTLYYHQIKQGTEVVRDYDDVGSILCYPDELNQVWVNLINNALHAMDYKGTLTIAIKRPVDSEELMVAVSDTGHGMSEEVKAKIFTPFFTTKRAGEGSGLGLDIVKKIIDQHQGRIEVESEVGRGTTFSIFLPVA